MSDIADMAVESVAAVEGAGGSFAGHHEEGGPNRLPDCECGARPVFRYCPTARPGGDQLETLGCSVCGNSVGPMSSRQALRDAWRLGGCRGQ